MAGEKTTAVPTERGQSIRELPAGELLERIGKGQNAEVYALDGGTVVKLFRAGAEPELAFSEFDKADTALRLGVPTARTYGMVRCGGRLGIVFERVDSPSLRQVAAAEPERLEALAAKGAGLLQKLNRLEVRPGTFPDMAEIYRRRAAALADLLTDGEINLLCRMIDSIPQRNTYLHGDFHRGNLMVRGDELLLIDMADSGMGHPLYDVLGVYMLGMKILHTMPEVVPKLIGWDASMVRQAWEVFRNTYFGTDDPAETAGIDDMMEAYSWLRWLTFLKLAPGFTEEMRRKEVRAAREQFFPWAERHIVRFSPRIAGMS